MITQYIVQIPCCCLYLLHLHAESAFIVADITILDMILTVVQIQKQQQTYCYDYIHSSKHILIHTSVKGKCQIIGKRTYTQI